MTAITIKAFGGLTPITSALLLGDSEATVAQNAKMIGGLATPMLGTTILKALTKANPATIWRYGNAPAEGDWWLEFAADTDVIRSPIAADPFGRAYWADGVEPRYGPNSSILSGSSYPGASFKLGVPAPADAPAAAGTPSETAALNETRIYVYTYVTAYGEEGPPSAVSNAFVIGPNSSASITGMSGAPSGQYNITLKRLYRSSTTSQGAQFQLVDELPVAQTTYTDTKAQSDLGEALVSDTWVAPPAGLRGLKMLANGAAVGFVGNTIHLSEPNMPHAWPHQSPMDQQIVAIGVFRQSAVVLTQGHPYLLTGADPAAMSLERLELPQACLSKRSVIETGDGVLYAGPDGLVSVGSGGMNVVTSKILSSRQWDEYNPSSMQCYYQDGRCHVFYTSRLGERGCLIFDFTGQSAVMSTTNISATAPVTAGYSDTRTDTLYLAQGGNLVRFNAGAPMMLTWRSKLFRLATPGCMAAATLDVATYPAAVDPLAPPPATPPADVATVRFYADGVLRHTQLVTSSEPFRLPTGFRAKTWQFEIDSTSDINRLRVATSIQELRASA